MFTDEELNGFRSTPCISPHLPSESKKVRTYVQSCGSYTLHVSTLYDKNQKYYRRDHWLLGKVLSGTTVPRKQSEFMAFL